MTELLPWPLPGTIVIVGRVIDWTTAVVRTWRALGTSLEDGLRAFTKRYRDYCGNEGM